MLEIALQTGYENELEDNDDLDLWNPASEVEISRSLPLDLQSI